MNGQFWMFDTFIGHTRDKMSAVYNEKKYIMDFLVKCPVSLQAKSSVIDIPII